MSDIDFRRDELTVGRLWDAPITLTDTFVRAFRAWREARKAKASQTTAMSGGDAPAGSQIDKD